MTATTYDGLFDRQNYTLGKLKAVFFDGAVTPDDYFTPVDQCAEVLYGLADHVATFTEILSFFPFGNTPNGVAYFSTILTDAAGANAGLNDIFGNGNVEKHSAQVTILLPSNSQIRWANGGSGNCRIVMWMWPRGTVTLAQAQTLSPIDELKDALTRLF